MRGVVWARGAERGVGWYGSMEERWRRGAVKGVSDGFDECRGKGVKGVEVESCV